MIEFDMEHTQSEGSLVPRTRTGSLRGRWRTQNLIVTSSRHLRFSIRKQIPYFPQQITASTTFDREDRSSIIVHTTVLVELLTVSFHWSISLQFRFARSIVCSFLRSSPSSLILSLLLFLLFVVSKRVTVWLPNRKDGTCRYSPLRRPW